MLTPITTATARTAGTEGKPGVVSWLLAPSPFGGREAGQSLCPAAPGCQVFTKTKKIHGNA